MGLEGLLRRGLSTLALGGALFSNGCLPEIRASSPMDTIFTEDSVYSVEKSVAEEVVDCVLSVSNRDFNHDKKAGNIYVTGSVECSYVVNKSELTIKTIRRPTPFGSATAFKVRQEYQRKDLSSDKARFVPSNLMLSLSGYDGGVKVDVNSDSSFKGGIHNPDFQDIAESKYFSVRREACDVIVSEADSSGRKPVGARFNQYVIGEVLKFSQEIKESAVRKYVDENINSKIVPITMNMRDSNTRVSVGVQRIIIKRESSPKIDEIVRNEFGDNEKLLVFVRSCIKYNSNEDAKVSGSGQSLSFNGFEGVKYSVETTDPAFHYTTSSFVADRRSPDKAVLLVEVGQKLRIDETKEGKGQIIDEK